MFYVIFSKDIEKEENPVLQENPTRQRVTIEYNKKEKTRVKAAVKVKDVPAVDPILERAEKVLVDLGFGVREARKLLNGVQANSVEEAVSIAMRKVEI
jgi:hypothetical protein